MTPVILPESLDDLKAYICAVYPNQCHESMRFLSVTDEPYVEISYFGIARDRKYDIFQVKKFVLARVASAFQDYARGKTGPGFKLYWRIELEDDLKSTMLVEHWDDSGPDKDFMTDRRCHGDHSWVKYGVYMRLLISDKPELPRK